MAFQDDAREIELRDLFKLDLPKGRGRQDTDAILTVAKKTIEFELKSTKVGGSVTTARDVGYSHLEKWKTKHWIIGMYANGSLSYTVYLPPRLLLDWIKKKENYIRPDFEILKLLHKKISLNEMFQLIGKKKVYSLKDAKAIQKEQMNSEEYLQRMDVKDGYSKDRMLSIIHDRVKYLVLRGYTLNNPHIPASVVMSGYKIEQNYPNELRALLNKEIS